MRLFVNYVLFVLYAYLAGLKPHTADEIDVTRISPKPNELRPKRTQRKKVSGVGQVSFDDYHALWSGIATTKPVSDAFNPLSEVLKGDSKFNTSYTLWITTTRASGRNT